MDRETPLLIAIAMLAVAALTVGVSGWVLLARDRTLRHSRTTASHPEVPEER